VRLESGAFCDVQTQLHLAMTVAIFHQGSQFEQHRNPLGNQVQMVRGGWHERQAAEQHRSLNETQRSSRARELEILLTSGAGKSDSEWLLSWPGNRSFRDAIGQIKSFESSNWLQRSSHSNVAVRAGRADDSR